MAQKRTTAIEKQDSFDYSSLEEFLKAEQSGEKDVANKISKFKLSLDNKRIEEAHSRQIALATQLMELEKTLEANNLKLTEAQKKGFLIKYQKEQANADKQRIVDYWKQYSASAKKTEKDAQTKLDKELKVYKEIAKLRASADEKTQKVIDNDEKIAKLKKELIEAQSDENKDEDKVKNLEQQIKDLKKENSTLKTESKAENAEADSEERKYKSETDFKKNFEELLKDFKEDSVGDAVSKDLISTMKGMSKAIKEGLNQINQAISTYANYQTSINARIQGAVDSDGNVKSFSTMVDTLSSVAYSPLLKTEDLYSNLSDLVSEGISYNVEQRAFLQTVKDGIATTFDANNSTLKRIIRLQQQDSTAVRLGMEAYLTEYLNELTSNTEYLQDTFDSVAESLLEASSLMSAEQSTEFEYVVQKWLGTLTGLGLDSSTATSISDAIGYLGSGNVSALNSSDMQNLLVMAASRAGLNYSDLLSNGLTANSTNQLMYSLVTYLADLGNSSSSNVVKSQLASTFGVSVSDLVAASNVMNSSSSTITNLYNNLLTYNDMYAELESQMGQLSEREGISNILENLFSNYQFQTGMSIASNPGTYATWKITDMIQGVTGGINIPYITALGNGVDLETTVENLMKIAIIGTSTLGGIGDIISGISSVGDGSSLLTSLGISSSNSNVVRRGTGYNARASGVSTSISTYAGNSSGSDYYSSTLSAAYDAQQDTLDQKTEETKTATDELNDYVQGSQREMFESMLDNIKSMNACINDGIEVTVKNWDITGLNL